MQIKNSSNADLHQAKCQKWGGLALNALEMPAKEYIILH